MLAVVKTDTKKGAQLKEIPIPVPGAEDVIVKVKAAAICGTDMHIYEWNNWAQSADIKTPVIMGHEFSGEVVAAGKDAAGVKIGDYVAGETHIPCGSCYQCRNGLQHICGNLKIFGVHTDGCFAGYAKIPAVCAKKIPESIKPEIGAILEPLGTSLRSCAEIQVSVKNIAVIGCGPIGLLAVASAKAMGAARIIAVDVIESRLDLALKMGADEILNPLNQDVVDEVLSLTAGVGVDGFIEASGSVTALSSGFKYLRKGGRAALIGLPSKPAEINLGPDVVFKEATVIGIHGRKMFETWTLMENMLEKGILNVEPVITHALPLDKFEEGFSLLEYGSGSKVILIP